MTFYYLSTVPLTFPSSADLIARSQLLKEAGVRYSTKEVWGSGDGFLPLLYSKADLDADTMEMLELRKASVHEVCMASEPPPFPR